jgi:hypothetical protein
MRQEIYDYIDGLSKSGFTLSSALPWTSDGVALYQKNFKTIYVDMDDVTHDTTLSTLDGLTFENETTTVRVYFTTDAKQLPSNYETLVSAIREARNTTDITGVTQRQCDVIRTFEADAMVTEIEFRFTKLI